MRSRRSSRGLAALPVGASVEITGVDLATRHRLRLAELGVRPGARVTVLARTAGGGRIIGFGADRLALDARTARRVDGAPA